jgi:dCMP deaminase
MDPRIRRLKEGALGSRPDWYEYGMGYALWTASRASCRKVRAGTYCTDEDHRTLTTGYNGAAPGIENCLSMPDCFKVLSTGKSYEDTMNSGVCIGVHGEMNALSKLDRTHTKGLVVFTTVFPCTSCAKNLLAYRPSQIVFKRFYDERETNLALDILQQGNVDVYRLDLSPERYLDILFNQQEVKFDAWSPDEREKMKSILQKIKE